MKYLQNESRKDPSLMPLLGTKRAYNDIMRYVAANVELPPTVSDYPSDAIVLPDKAKKIYPNGNDPTVQDECQTSSEKISDSSV